MADRADAARGAGQTIIEERYTRMASQRKLIRALNNAAVFFAICFMAAQMIANNANTGDASLKRNELLAVSMEMAVWFMIVAGLGFGKAAREKPGLLGAAQLLAAASIIVHVLALNPDRLNEIGAIMTAEKPDMVNNYQKAGVVAQVLSLLTRMAMVYFGKAHLEDRKAAKPSTVAKKKD